MADEASKKSRRRAATTPELFAALEALLPFAEKEVNFREDMAAEPPGEPEHEEDVEKALRGRQAIKNAEELIRRKSSTIRRKQRELERK